jgi:hypothetical protein
VTLDTTGLSRQQVVDRVLELVEHVRADDAAGER